MVSAIPGYFGCFLNEQEGSGSEDEEEEERASVDSESCVCLEDEARSEEQSEEGDEDTEVEEDHMGKDGRGSRPSAAAGTIQAHSWSSGAAASAAAGPVVPIAVLQAGAASRGAGIARPSGRALLELKEDTAGFEAHIAQSDLESKATASILSQWLGEDRGLQAALPEYQPAADRICLVSDLMTSSRLGRCLKFLEERMSERRRDAPRFRDVLQRTIRKAYDLQSNRAARNHTAEVPGLEGGNVYSGAMTYYGQLQWEQPYLTEALELLCEREDAGGLQVVLGIMLSGANWCHARKNHMFNTILDRLRVPTVEECPVTDSDPPAVASAKLAIREATIELVEDVKDQALKTTFLEPTKMHFRARGESVREDQVDVHGANTYLAVLSATLGVQLNRRPHLGDSALGCVDFLAEDPSPAAWAEQYFGLDWESVGDLRRGLGARGEVQSRVGFFEYVSFIGDFLTGNHSFVFWGSRPRDVANAAVDPRGDAERRRHLARYLEKFASWFSEDFLLPRMVSRLTGEAGRCHALQVLLEDLLSREPGLAGDEDEQDVRFWLWDMAELPARFRPGRAAVLLRHAGVLREACT